MRIRDQCMPELNLYVLCVFPEGGRAHFETTSMKLQRKEDLIESRSVHSCRLINHLNTYRLYLVMCLHF